MAYILEGTLEVLSYQVDGNGYLADTLDGEEEITWWIEWIVKRDNMVDLVDIFGEIWIDLHVDDGKTV